MRSKHRELLVFETPVVVLFLLHLGIADSFHYLVVFVEQQVHTDRCCTQDNENRVLPVAQAEDFLRVHAELFCILLRCIPCFLFLFLFIFFFFNYN